MAEMPKGNLDKPMMHRAVRIVVERELVIEFLQPGGSTSSRAAATAVELQFAL
jgi:hypothetical protein